MHYSMAIDAKAVNSAKSAKPPKKIGPYKPGSAIGSIIQLTLEESTLHLHPDFVERAASR